MNEPRVTVIIPTRERSEVLRACLRTVTTQDYSNLEILVSDNASADETFDVVHSLDDSRIRYVNPGKRLGMSHHWEFALSHVTDGWVTLLGDDDGLLPNAIDQFADIVSNETVLAVRSDAGWYNWPSLTGMPYGRMGVPLGSTVSMRDSNEWLSKVLNGCATYMSLPMLYTGTFIHTSVIRKIKAQNGTFYRSSIPDIYSAIAIASVEPRYLFAARPLALAGLSSRSTGVSFFSGAKNDDEGQAEHVRFLQEGMIPFHESIPLDSLGYPPKSNQALILESLLQFKRPMGAETIARFQHQLEIILATAGANRVNVRAWAVQFADQHHLDLGAAAKRAASFKYRVAFQTMGERWRRGVNTAEVGSNNSPIRDVYEASIVAAAIRDGVPGRATNAIRYLKTLGKRTLWLLKQ